MQCKTIIEYNNKGKPVWKDKVKHASLEIARRQAYKINKRKDIFIKRDAYQCKKCGMFHVGTTTEMLLNKKIPKVRQWIGREMKVVGFVDLQGYTKELKRIIDIKEIRNIPKKFVNGAGLTTIRQNGRLISSEFIIEDVKYMVKVNTKSISISVEGKTKYVQYSKIYDVEKLNRPTGFTPGLKEIKTYIFNNYKQK